MTSNLIANRGAGGNVFWWLGVLPETVSPRKLEDWKFGLGASQREELSYIPMR